MHRRNALTFIAFSTLAPTLVLAQQRGSGEGGLGEAAKTYIENTLKVGGLALATSRIAQEKASTPWVKRFANYETAEQEGVAGIFQGLLRRAPEADAEQQQAVEQLNGLSGERFEQTYLQDQAQGHQQLLRIQDDFIKVGHDSVLAEMAKLIRGRVEEHIDLIQAIRDQMHQTVKR